MQISPHVKSVMQGAIVGAVATIAIGFYWGGWVLGSTAEKMAQSRSETAVVGALTPSCVAQFKEQPGAAGKLEELKKAQYYDRRQIIEKTGWANVNNKPNSNLAEACVKQLTS